MSFLGTLASSTESRSSSMQSIDSSYEEIEFPEVREIHLIVITINVQYICVDSGVRYQWKWDGFQFKLSAFGIDQLACLIKNEV